MTAGAIAASAGAGAAVACAVAGAGAAGANVGAAERAIGAVAATEHVSPAPTRKRLGMSRLSASQELDRQPDWQPIDECA